MTAPLRAPRTIEPGHVTVMLVMVAALAAGIGMRDPAPPDEPRFVLVARDMVENGAWLFPHRGTELYSHKPPLFMWLQASAFRVVHDWRVAFLIPSLFAALGTLWMTWDLARRLWNRHIAMYAVAALFATLQFGLQAKRGQIDMVLMGFTTLALWALVRHLLVCRNPGLAALGGLAAGLGTVTKGVGFLPLLVFLPWRALPATLRGARPVAGRWVAAGFVLGALVWLAPMLWAALGSQDTAIHAYVDDLLFRQTGTRYATPWHHQQPPWYFLQVMATLWLPGVLLAPWLLPAWWRRVRRRDPRHWLLLGWGLLVLLFFTLSPGKREVYILPALPAFCLAAAPVVLFNHGHNARSFTYIDDIVDGVVRVLQSGDEGAAEPPDLARVFNIGNPVSTPLPAFVSSLSRALGRKARLQFAPPAAADATETTADTRLFEATFGPQQFTALDAGLARFAHWMRGECAQRVDRRRAPRRRTHAGAAASTAALCMDPSPAPGTP